MLSKNLYNFVLNFLVIVLGFLVFYYIYEIFEFNFFSYISVRAGISFFLAFVLTLFFMPRFIAWARVKNANQPI